MRLSCCRREKEISFDIDDQERIVTYNGLESIESCILSSSCCGNESSDRSRGNGFPSDSMEEDASSCSSSKDPIGSFSSHWVMNHKDEDEWEVSKNSPQSFPASCKDKQACSPRLSLDEYDVDSMKERFAKLLLGEDASGGRWGLSTALALSNAIINLAASVFGELWKLEPLPEDRKRKWHREMDWLLSPTNHMVELVPAKQDGANGRTLEIMTPKMRSDIHMYLPALQKLDAMLITLDSMVDTEFWYAEGGSRAEGRRQNMKWWLPSPRVPRCGLSSTERRKLGYRGKYVHQVLKAARSINQHVLLEMPVPSLVSDALPKSGRANLGEHLYKALRMERVSVEEIFRSMDFKTEHATLEIANRVEAAVFAWKQRISLQMARKSPARHSWPFVRDPELDMDKMETLVERAETLVQLLKSKFPNLPQTFLHVIKVQYNKDVGHSIMEAYSRVLGSLAFSILSRISDILQEDDLNKPDSPLSCFKLESYSQMYLPGISEAPVNVNHRVRHSLIEQMKKVERRVDNSSLCRASEEEFSDQETRTSTSSAATPSRSRVWCYGREACSSLSPWSSP
ncbi:rop guanine nucleotide exchange factor 14-like isoform X2 [Aristolochia californica]|uniref:rop guanine nucleotide exchange factor 14-like isoform X2 n=1 Tax=Aristolochia californica TaxID=171875 RepID=UPI0035DE327A